MRSSVTVFNDTEPSSLKTRLRPERHVLEIDTPLCSCFLYGLSGLGKTACMRYKIDALTAAVTNYDDIHYRERLAQLR